MNEWTIRGLLGGLAFAGATARTAYGFLQAKKDKPDLKWNWTMFATEALPAGFGAFALAWLGDVNITPASIITLLFGGVGIGSTVSKVVK